MTHVNSEPGSTTPSPGSTTKTSPHAFRKSNRNLDAYLPLLVSKIRRETCSVDFTSPKSTACFSGFVSVAVAVSSPSAGAASALTSGASGKLTSTSIFHVSPCTTIVVLCVGASVKVPFSSNTCKVMVVSTVFGSGEPNLTCTACVSPGASFPVKTFSSLINSAGNVLGVTNRQRTGTRESFATMNRRAASSEEHSRLPKNTPGGAEVSVSVSSSLDFSLDASESSALASSSALVSCSAGSPCSAGSTSDPFSPSPDSPSPFGFRVNDRTGTGFDVKDAFLVSTPRIRSRFFCSAFRKAAASARFAFSSAARFLTAVRSG
mmetsp:Transcript_11191/g.41482  ORF Transcript_11191/g.41482 Transcript_11191/m.41482 type:complete len:320 (+) Transcript_11191:6866-7825(+)